MNNVVLNKPTSGTKYIKPYSPSRAVDGSGKPVDRWLGNTPCDFSVNLLDSIWIDRWVVYHMGSIGWFDGNYNNQDYKLCGSNDGMNWFVLDSVNGNTNSSTDRTFLAQEVRYVQLMITEGLNINPQLASVAELFVYEAAPTSSQLSNLELNVGSLTPNFTSDNFQYSVEVGASIDSIILTPTSLEDATIKVNGISVDSGSASGPISLAIGENTINIEVTSKVGAIKSLYKVVVTRAVNLYLTSVELAYSGRGYSETDTVDMNHTSLSYSDTTSVKAKTVKITPTAEDDSVTITINGEAVLSGVTTSDIDLPDISNTITLVVSKSETTEIKTYILTIEKS